VQAIKYFVFTGPESTGKTTLALESSKNFNLLYIEEYARFYLSYQLGKYKESDLNHIADAQMMIENKSQGISICDTDLLTIYIWKMEKYGVCDLKWAEQLSNYIDRFYFLCKADIPWVYDDLRENPIDRDRLFEIYKEQLEFFGLKYRIVEGNLKERKKVVFESVTNTLR
jgi:nicotinamide riboside kinase